MSYVLDDKVKALKPYDSGRKRKAVYLDANESFLPIPADIKREIVSKVRKVDFHRYPDPKAAKCCKAFAGYYGIDPALVTAGNGSDELISIIMQGFFSRGDKVLVTEPDFSMYAFYAQIAELKTVVYTKGDDYRIEPDALIQMVRDEGCKGLVFSNPCNPTSQGLRKMPMRAILKALPDVLVILDEAYMDFWNQSMLSEIGEYDNLIILRTASKALGSAAVRLGFAVAGKKITKAIQALKSPYNVNSMTQAAGQAILKYPDLLKDALMDILAGRGYMAGALTKLEAEWADTPYAFHLVPESKTNFMVLCFTDKEKHGMIYEYLKKNGVLVRCFPDFLRVTVGSNEENQLFLEALASAYTAGTTGQTEN